MNDFEKQLQRWNQGVLRGAQAKLAKVLGVSTATTALWATGKRKPSKGYIFQMAQLFGLDEYEVGKLFTHQPAVFYPDPISSSRAQLLRDGDENTFYTNTPILREEDNTPANSVLLPYVAHVNAQPPYYFDTDVLEWWRIPRRYAQGAAYLVSSVYIGVDNAYSADDLCFIKPITACMHNGVFVFTDGKDHFVTYRVIHKRKHPQYFTLQGISATLTKGFSPVGEIVKRIHSV